MFYHFLLDFFQAINIIVKERKKEETVVANTIEKILMRSDFLKINNKCHRAIVICVEIHQALFYSNSF